MAKIQPIEIAPGLTLTMVSSWAPLLLNACRNPKNRPSEIRFAICGEDGQSVGSLTIFQEIGEWKVLDYRTRTKSKTFASEAEAHAHVLAIFCN